MPLAIRAAVCRSFGAPLAVETLTLADPGPGAVRVRITACAVCQSDIGYAAGAWGGTLPCVFGHEAAGVVEATGPGVATPAVGERVLVTLIRPCGGCPSCRAGAVAHCESPPPLATPLADAAGAPVAQGLMCGAFAEAVVVAASQVVPLPADLPAEAACLLACGVITGVGAAVNAARIRPGEAVVVIGAGGVGLNAIQGAALAGAARIVAVDVSEAKLADARAFGATAGVLATAARPWRAAQEALGGRGADVVLVATGAIAAYESAPRYLARRGRLVMVGMPPSGARTAIEPVILAQLGQSLVGSYMGEAVPARDIPWLVDLWRQGRLKLEPLVSRTWPLEAINEAIADTRAGAARRNVIVMAPAPGQRPQE
jgi:S-(hydroxymethyl)mycothiol dehydrogenase